MADTLPPRSRPTNQRAEPLPARTKLADPALLATVRRPPIEPKGTSPPPNGKRSSAVEVPTVAAGKRPPVERSATPPPPKRRESREEVPTLSRVERPALSREVTSDRSPPPLRPPLSASVRASEPNPIQPPAMQSLPRSQAWAANPGQPGVRPLSTYTPFYPRRQ